jgi:hypothetical protein
MNFGICFNGKPLTFNNIHNSSTRVDIPGCKENELLLAFKMDMNEISFSLLPPNELPIGYLSVKKIFNHAYLLNHLLSDTSIKGLRNAILEITDIHELNQVTLVLINYFFFSDASMSVTLMADWLTESGVSSEDSESLAMAIYMAATDRQDDDLNFIHGLESCILNSSKHELPEIQIINSVQSFFSHSFLPDTAWFVYDDYQQYCNFSGEKIQELYHCGNIPETSFLVEDHDHLILGLSCRLSEVMSICEFSVPEFYTFIKHYCSFSERSRMSLASFMEKFYAEVIQLASETGIKCSIKLLDNHNKAFAINLQECITPLGFSYAVTGHLPVFMDIEKARQTIV